MRFNKLSAKQLFDGYRIRENSVLILKDDGAVENIVSLEEAGDDVQEVEGVLTPGFVNCHCHLELSHLKGAIPEQTGLTGFLLQIMQKRVFPEETILQAIVDAEQEMQESGIVAVGDICNTTHTLTQKQKNNLYYHNFVEAMGAQPAAADRNFGIYKSVYRIFSDHFSMDRVSLTPHAPYSMSDALWEKLMSFPQNGILSIHNQETEAENLWFEQKTGAFEQFFKALGMGMDFFKPSGKTSLQTYLHHFRPGHRVILVHNVYTSPSDIAFVHQAGTDVFWCLCPHANFYISRMLPPVELLMQNNCNIVLGTDSLASNHQLSIAAEIKLLQQYFPAIPLENMLQWATLNGARALKIDHQYGSFEKGKKPGIAVFK